jgi:hypothetical protein
LSHAWLFIIHSIQYQVEKAAPGVKKVSFPSKTRRIGRRPRAFWGKALALVLAACWSPATSEERKRLSGIQTCVFASNQ